MTPEQVQADFVKYSKEFEARQAAKAKRRSENIKQRAKEMAELEKQAFADKRASLEGTVEQARLVIKACEDKIERFKALEALTVAELEAMEAE